MLVSRLRRLGARFGAFLFFALLMPLVSAKTVLDFEHLYGSFSPLGLEFSAVVKENVGKHVSIEGFMAPPLKAEAQFFVLTKMPMSICPFCSTDADWPADIMVVYLKKKQTFVQYNQRIKAEGRLEIGSWTDPETGFVSQLRLRDATFSTL